MDEFAIDHAHSLISNDRRSRQQFQLSLVGDHPTTIYLSTWLCATSDSGLG
jgi:hypothetical protein